MSRKPRERSSTGIYHIMLRGIDKRAIFLSNRDYENFLDCILKAKDKSEFTLYAYCLMTNHIHMLLKTGSEDVGDIVRRIAVRYAQYYNSQNRRSGHLFENRFKSEPVDNDSYFITVLRYIHRNPIKAGIVHKIDDYQWSSYHEYINANILIDPQFALDLFGDTNSFEIYMSESDEEECLDINSKYKYGDDELRTLILAKTDISKLKDLDRRTRNEILREIKSTTTASNRQLSRILNISRTIIDKID